MMFTAVSKIAKARGERQTSFEIRKCGARRPTLDYEENIWSASLFSSSSQRFSRCVARDSRGRGKNAATLLLFRAVSPDSTRDGKNRNDAEKREGETDGDSGKKSTIVSFLCNV